VASLVASFPDWLVSLVQWLLLIGELAATAVVGWGIIWESPEQSSSRHRIATRLVIWGIIAESFCSICLFSFDEAIARNQGDKILALDVELNAQKKKTAEAETHLAELRKQVGPRSIDGPGFLRILGDGPRASVEIVYAKDDQDAYSLAIVLSAVLRQAKWNVANDLVPENNSEILKLAKTLPSNIFVQAREISTAEMGAMLSLATEDGGLRTPYSVLSAALLQSGLWLQGSANPTLPVDTLRVIIASKP